MALKEVAAAGNGRTTSDMLLFAWVSEVEGSVRSKRPRSLLGPERTEASPLLKARTHMRRTFSAGQNKDRTQRVKEAREACLWLREAGFPQYVQMFYDGQFPINLTQFEVEPDHSFLDQTSIDALIRRINTLNRCAYLADELKSDSDDDLALRALSRRWYFRKGAQRWFRRQSDPLHRRVPPGSSYRPSSAPHDCTTWTVDGREGCGRQRAGGSQRPMLVSDLSCSLTSIPSSVKTYSFSLSEERPTIPESPRSQPETLERLPSVIISDVTTGNSKVLDTSTLNGLCSSGSNSSTHLDGTEGEEPHPVPLGIGSMESFTDGIMKTFDSSLRQLHQKALSLPDVFADSNSRASSCSVSMTSIVESSSKDDSSIMEDRSRRCSTPSINPDFEYRLAVSSSDASQTHECNACSSFADQVDGTNGTHSPYLSLSEEDSSSDEHVEDVSHVHKGDKSGKKDKPLGRVSHTKWHSFQKMHSFRLAINSVRTLIPLEELSVGQVEILRKVSLIKLTGLIELHDGKASVTKIMKEKKLESIDHPRHESSVFGAPLSANVRQYGHPLPPVILRVIKNLKQTWLSTTGLFRRAAAKPKVENLKQLVEEDPVDVDFESFSPYEMADLLKLYFRELPEPLISHKLTEVLITINERVPRQVQLQLLRSIMLLMPDENRVTLQTLLGLLKEVANHSEDNQMDANNLAVCLSPTLFSNSVSKVTNHHKSFRKSRAYSPSVSTSKEVSDSVSTSQCLAEMIRHCDQLFTVEADMMQVCNFTHLEIADPVPFHELGMDKMGNGNYSSFIDNTMTNIAKEVIHKFKGWVYHSTTQGAEVSFLEVDDGLAMRLWKASADIPCSADIALKKLWSERHVWDSDVMQFRVVHKVDDQTEVFQYVTSALPPYTHRDHCTFRSWRYDRALDCYIVIATSVTHPSANLLAGIRSIQMASHYVIEPLGESDCRITHLCRVDMRGHSADYYGENYGPYLASHSVLLLRRMIEQLEELDFLETQV